MSSPVSVEDPQGVARLIDHTLLKPEAEERGIEKLCEEAREWNFASVCVNPFWVPLCASIVAGSVVQVCTVLGFPLGANTQFTKLAEADQALEAGATELDLVQNIGALKSNQMASVSREIEDIARRVQQKDAILKVILETSLLTEEEIVWSCRIAVRSGADFVKTSTGFAKGGATKEHVALMRRTVGAEKGVKASGGIRSLITLREMVAAGASRIGTSAGVAIMQELNTAKSKPAGHSEGGY